MDSRKVIKKLEDEGFRVTRIKGSHHRMQHPDGRATTVPHPNKDLPKGTIKAIEKQTKVKLT